MVNLPSASDTPASLPLANSLNLSIRNGFTPLMASEDHSFSGFSFLNVKICCFSPKSFGFWLIKNVSEGITSPR